MNNIDCRVIKFSKWILPKTKSYFSMKNEMGLTVGYFDFVNVEKINNITHPLQGYITTKNNNWKDFAKMCKEKIDNKAPIESDKHDLTSQQIYAFTNIGTENLNLAIYDKEKLESFWTDKAFLRYYSLLHISDAVNKESIKQIISKINKEFGQNNGTYRTICYFSLDYSDIIICSKDYSITEFTKAIFRLNYNSNENRKLVRDSFSLLSIDMEMNRELSFIIKENIKTKKYDELVKLVNEFAYKNNLNTDYFNDNFISSFNVGIQNYQIFESAKNELLNIGLKFECYKMLGRHDVTISSNNSNLIWLIIIQNVIDTYSTKNNKNLEFINKQINEKNALFNCEAYIRIPFDKSEKYIDVDPESHYSLYYSNAKNVLENALKNLNVETINKLKSEHLIPIMVLSNSILELLKNGFADDFVLCIFESYIVFLNYYIDKCNDDRLYIRDSLDTCLNNYFDNVNALINSAMHGDRQFIQSPSFNPVFYDVPPKLMAYYTAMTHKINGIIRTVEDKGYKYSFMFRPSFSREIKLIPYSYEENAPADRLLTVMINETYLYYPYTVISQMCHEIAHYVGDGNRKRKTRKVHFIKCMLYDLCYNFVDEYLDSNIIDIPIISWVDDIFEIVEKEFFYNVNVEYSVNFRNLFYQTLSNIFNNSRKYENVHKKFISKIAEDLKDLSKDIIYIRFIEYLKQKMFLLGCNYQDEPIETIKIIEKVFSEIYADLQMILILDMSLEEYLEQFLNFNYRDNIKRRADSYYRILNIVILFTFLGKWKVNHEYAKKNNLLKNIYENMHEYFKFFFNEDTEELVEDFNFIYNCKNFGETLEDIIIYNSEKPNKIYNYWNFRIQSYLLESYYSSEKSYFGDENKKKKIEEFRDNINIVRNFNNATDVFCNIQNTNYLYANEIYDVNG